MRVHRRRFLTLTSAAIAAPAFARRAYADAWPKDRVIRAIVPFSAGSTIDILGRVVMDALSPRIGQTIVVENHGGAGGTIGTAMVAKADPDGYTLLINASAHSAAPAAYPKLSYDAAKDFAAVAMFGVVPNVMTVSPSQGLKSVHDLVERGKKGGMTYASAGVGSATHWAAERFLLAAGFRATHVPFRGGPEALTEVMAARVDFCLLGVSSSIGLIRSSQLQALAVSTLRRSPALPDVPTTTEAGYPESDYTFWNGLLVPAKTPREIVQKLHDEAAEAIKAPAVQAKFAPQGVDPLPLSPQDFDAMIGKEIASNLKLAQAAGLKFN